MPLDPDTFTHHDTHEARSGVFLFCAVTFIVVSGAFAATNFSMGLPIGSWAFNAAVIPVVALLILAERRFGYSPRLAFVSILTLSVTVIVSAFFSGGIYTGDIYWVLFIPLSAALLSVGRQSAMWGILSFASVLLICWAHARGMTLGAGTVMPADLVDRHTINALGVVAAASSITWAYTTLHGRALERAHEALARAETQSLERDEVARALDDALAHLRALTDHTDALIFSFDSDLELLSFNAPTDAFFTRLGRGPLAPGKPLLDLHVDSTRRARELYERAIQGESFTSDFVFGPEDDRLTFEVNFYPVVLDGKASMVTVLARDITRQRDMERERILMRESASERERLEGLGVMAGAFAHDFNNLLTGILGEIELAGESLEDDDLAEVRESLAAARSATIRAADTTRTLLTYAGRRPKRTELLDARDCARSARTLARSATGRALEIELLVEDDPALIHGDIGQLEQLLLNLLINAIQATLEHHDTAPPPVRLRVHCRAIEPDIGQVVIEVSDGGPGLSKDSISRIFEPFYSTKEHGQGLGLAAASGIARSHHGHLGVESTLGDGATFRLVLPRTTTERPSVPPPPSKNELDASGLVLLVDDNDDVRTSLVRMLERVGLEVVSVDNGRDALDAWNQHAPRLTIVDMLMPGMNGGDVLAAIKARDPHAPVLLISGYTDQDIERLILAHPPDTVLFCSKPISLDELFGALDHLLTTDDLPPT